MLAVGEDGFAALYRAEFRHMTQSVFLVVGSAFLAEEIVQEAFARAWARWDRVSTMDNPAGWVQTVAFRLALRAKRRAQRVADAESLVVGSSFGADSSVSVVAAALGGLPPMQRAVIALRFFDDLPMEEVAKRLGCRPATARVHLHRARLRLADAMTQEALHGI
jgi:RNA polymerase sigma-70 factor (ECF subfamily)